MNAQPLLSIIIVTHNSARWLPGCLGSITAATRDTPAEVWVVDNASRDGSIEEARRLSPSVNIIANAGNAGFARGNNQAIARSRGSYLLLLNPDAEINERALTGMIGIMEREPDVGLVGCRLVRPDGEPQECYGVTYPGVLNRSPAVRPWPGHPELVDAAWLGGACLLARRRAVEEVGGLDADYLMYYEDVDWGLRMRRGEWRVVYWDGGQALHHGGGDTTQVPSAETARRYITSEMLFHAKHSSRLLMSAVWIARLGRALRGIVWYGLLRMLGRDRSDRYPRYQAWARVLLRRDWTKAQPASEVQA
jgi:N-acetylglucosaminyl-diphospho-decaprenol L-rhamnosyltransferase